LKSLIVMVAVAGAPPPPAGLELLPSLLGALELLSAVVGAADDDAELELLLPASADGTELSFEPQAERTIAAPAAAAAMRKYLIIMQIYTEGSCPWFSTSRKLGRR
jgi:hypothetical protein